MGDKNIVKTISVSTLFSQCTISLLVFSATRATNVPQETFKTLLAANPLSCTAGINGNQIPTGNNTKMNRIF